MKRGILGLLLLIPFVVSAQLSTANLQNKSTIEFVENKGQIADEYGTYRPEILYTAQLKGAKAFITRKGIHYVFSNGLETYRMDMVWENANTSRELYVHNPISATRNFYLPHCPQGIIGVRGYEKIELKNVYPNVDVLLYSKDGWLEYDFVVRRGGDVSNIKIKYTGTEKITLLANGALKIGTPLGGITENAPISFQDGKAIKSAFEVNNGVVSFIVDKSYDRTKTLTIDPIIKIWGTYYGGDEVDKANTLFTDKQGNIYIGGTTNSTNNIAFNGHSNTLKDSSDVFVAKFDKNGTRLWATYYGGENNDIMSKIFTDFTENVFYLCGMTFSDSAIAYGGYQMEKGGKGDVDDCDAFLVKFDSSGVRGWATYLGGYDNEIVYGGTTDPNGSIYISGATTSPTGISFSGYQNTYGDAYATDAFFAKYAKSGLLQWSTYYGALFSEDYALIAAGKNGEIYVAGYTENADLAYKGYKNTYAGGKDVYIAKFDAANCTRIWNTYIGGTGLDNIKDIITDANGNICITGYTESQTGIAFNGHRTTMNGSSDIYVAKLDTAGKPIWSTYYGGEDDDVPLKIATDKDNNIIVSGVALSNTGIKTGSFGNTKSGNTDAFAVKFNDDGYLDWGTYFGGNGDEDGYCATNDLGVIYLCGTTTSTNSISYNGHQDTLASKSDGYLVKFSPHTAYKYPFIKDIYCPGEDLKLKYELRVTLDSSNTFVLQLSGSDGTFGTAFAQSPVKGGFVTGLDSIKLVLPDTLTGNNHYKVRLISTAPVDTIETHTFTVRENPVAKIAVLDSQECLKGNSFKFADSSGVRVQAWKWQFDDGDVSFFPNPAKTYLKEGSYSPQLKITDLFGCTGGTTTHITVLPTPIVGFEINTTQMCLKSNQFNFKDTTKGTITAYGWKFGDTGAASVSALANPTKKYLADGAFTIWHSVTNDNGCTDSSAQLIRVFPEPVIAAINGKTVVAKNTTHGYEVDDNVNDIFSWIVEEGTIVSGNGTNKIVVFWDSDNIVGKVRVVAISNFGCISDTVEVIVVKQTTGITGTNHPDISFYPNPTINWVTFKADNYSITRLVCYDVLGKATLLQPIEANTYSTQLLAQGVYMIQVFTDKGEVFTAKLIKQ